MLLGMKATQVADNNCINQHSIGAVRGHLLSEKLEFSSDDEFVPHEKRGII